MAVKDLALFKLVGSVVKKTKDKIVGGSTKIVKENEANSENESVKETFKAAVGKGKESIATESKTVGEKVKDSSREDSTEAQATMKVDAIKTAKKKIVESSKKRETKKVTAKKSKEESSKKVDKKALTLKEEKAETKKSPTKKVTKKAVTKEKKKQSAVKAPAGTKREEKIKLYTADIKKHLASVDDSFLAVIVKNLGPSIYRKDAELVSCSDAKELETVRRNFLIKKLGFDKSENEMLDGEIQKVCETLKGVRTKYRATFYYMLAKNLKKESALS